MIRTLTAFLFLVVLTSQSAFGGVLSFREWKGRRVQEAKSAALQIQHNHSAVGLMKIRKIGAANLRIQAAQELSPNDYFHLYVLPIHGGSPEALKKIVSKLSKPELAEIVAGYVDQTQRLRQMPRPAPQRIGSL